MKCIICEQDSVYWIDSYTSEDYGIEQDGLIHEYVCNSCGSEYSVFVPSSVEKADTSQLGASQQTWIEIKNKHDSVVALRCPRCGKSPKHGARSDFCPNCGADMRRRRD